MGTRGTVIYGRSIDRRERAAAVLRRAIQLARLAVRGVAILALISAVSAGLAWVTWIVGRPPTDPSDWGARVVVLGIALVPPAILGLFLAGLRELAELPRRARTLPPDLRAELAHARARATQPRGRASLVGPVVRLARLLLDARDVLSPYAVVTAALRPTLLLAAVVAALVATLEIPAALLAALVVIAT